MTLGPAGWASRPSTSAPPTPTGRWAAAEIRHGDSPPARRRPARRRDRSTDTTPVGPGAHRVPALRSMRHPMNQSGNVTARAGPAVAEALRTRSVKARLRALTPLENAAPDRGGPVMGSLLPVGSGVASLAATSLCRPERRSVTLPRLVSRRVLWARFWDGVSSDRMPTRSPIPVRLHGGRNSSCAP